MNSCASILQLQHKITVKNVFNSKIEQTKMRKHQITTISFSMTYQKLNSTKL